MLRAFLDYLHYERRLSPRTLTSYRHDIEDLLAWLHDHGDLDPAVDGGADLLGDEHAGFGIDAVLARAEQGLARELEQDAAVAGARIGRDGLGDADRAKIRS